LCIEGVIFHMLVLGHRGASAAFAENTVPALRGALEQGADGAELDVRRTADGRLVVRHDPLPEDLPREVPLLSEALDALRGAAVVNIEVKNLPDDPEFDPHERVAAEVVDLLRERGELGDGRTLVSCFHRPTIDRVRELAPELATGWLVIDPTDPRVIEGAARRGHVAIHPHHVFVNLDVVQRAHAAGLAVYTWTCDDPERIVWLAELGVDAVITNDPARALAALGR
jgi:glycerophosphoryl diester phosphodiesterase